MKKGIKLFTILISIIALCLMPFKLYAYTYEIIPADTPFQMYSTGYYKFDKDVKVNSFISGSNANIQFQCDTSFNYNVETTYQDSIDNNTYDHSCSTLNIYGTTAYYFNYYSSINNLSSNAQSLLSRAITTEQSGSNLSSQGALIYHHDLISPKISHYNGGDIFQSWETTDPSNPYYISNVNDFYVFAIKNTAYLVSTNQQFTYTRGNTNSTWNGTSLTIDNTTYYYYSTGWSYSSSYHYGFTWDTNLGLSGVAGLTAFIYICYNYLSPLPPSPINYGELNDLGFYTAFTNTQQSTLQTMKYNKDVFSWDNTYDTLGNQINVPVGAFMVDIQGALSDYEANTKSDLLNQVLNDASIGNWNDIASVSANAGTYQLTWEDAARAIMGVYDYNTNIFEELVVRPFEGYYIKKGWIYRVRLRVTDNSYTGNWQIVYNLTSMPPKDSNNVINHYYVYNNTLPSDDTNEVLQTINQYNNTVNNWYINDTPIPVDSNDSDNTLLQTILNLLNGSDDSSLISIGDETQHTINNAINTEDDYLDDLQDQLDNLELNDISDNDGLMNSLNWIRQVHNLTIEQTLYSGIVITILSVGLIIYLIGRRNG